MLTQEMFWMSGMWIPPIKPFTGFFPIRYIKSYVLVKRGGSVIRYLTPYKPFEIERKTQAYRKDAETVSSGERISRLKLKWRLRIIRNGKVIYTKKRIRDLMPWRGQSIFAYLLSQGVVGTNTASWKIIASENETIPDMGDDSGNPEANEFSPVIGTPVDANYEFEPEIKPSGGYQTYANLIIKGIVVSDGSKTLRKHGVIDTIAVPNRHIIVEDSVIPFPVILNDNIEIVYTIQFG